MQVLKFFVGYVISNYIKIISGIKFTVSHSHFIFEKKIVKTSLKRPYPSTIGLMFLCDFIKIQRSQLFWSFRLIYHGLILS